MGDWGFNIENIVSLSATNNDLSQLISPYLAKQMWSSNDRKKLLNELAKMFLRSPKETSIINFAHSLGPIMQDVLQRCFKLSADGDVNIMDNFKILIGELIRVNFPNFLELMGIEHFLERCVSARYDDHETCPTKKPKISSIVSINAGLSSIAWIVRSVPAATVNKWPWKDFLQCALKVKDDLDEGGVSSLIEILSFILRLKHSTMEAMKLQETSFDFDKEFENCSRQYSCQLAISEGRITVSNNKASYTKRALTGSDFSDNVVVAAGVLIQNHCQESTNVPDSNTPIVITDSIQRCLHSLALGTTNRHPIMLLGSAGCGKTTVLKYFAKSIVKKKLIEVQLGDGVDSKVLSGIYKCTAISGEFEWQPGVLAQAVSNGDWILLEDIDKAPLDVISLLLPLLENRSMKSPGHSNMENDTSNSSGFRIFMTCRTSVENDSPNTYVTKLMRHSRCIKLDAFSDNDLKLIIETNFPRIKPISDKVLEIYKTVRDATFEDFSFDARACKRSLAVRDLLRFCSRIATHMKNKDGCDLGQAVSSEAVDCLVTSTISNQERKQKIQTIFSLLNLSSSNAEYFCQSYRPEILFQNEYATLGRVSLVIKSQRLNRRRNSTQLFALNRSSSILIEQLACAVQMQDPVLLVGETGVGKTTGIQFLADKLGCTLHIVNISQQSSSSDLLGAFKPIQRQHLIAPVRNEFEKLFVETFSKHQNVKFLSHVQVCYLNKRFSDLLKLMLHGCKQALKKSDLSESLRQMWHALNTSIIDLKSQIKVQESVAFTFVEGILSKALKNGDWLLLDEINLASPETLDCLSSVLESDKGSVSLLEIGDTKPIKRHPDFRIFAAMNPATDVGKRNLPNNIRSRFLEIFVSEPRDDADLLSIIGQYLKNRSSADNSIIAGVLKFYRQICQHSFHDGSPQGIQKPLYSLRSLCRALRYVTDNPKMNLIQALFEGLCLAFMTEVDHTRHESITKLILKNVVGTSKAKSVVSGTIPRPLHKHVTVKGYHIKCGCEEPYRDEKYIMTPHIEKNLKVLARAVSYGKYPVLIQGETSTGKTSMINYLATLTGNKVFRINNHEHTDLQEYIGTYSSDSNGKFYFQEGPLVTAMRDGHWIILDELNLAPTDILESLNRVLDDNRELFIPETQETVVAHPRFALFATQNPPGLYGGRKVLSRALRNRFIELHFGQIPSDEISTILHLRCDLPMSRCKKLINVMEDLQEKRSTSGIFAGKHSYITLRDLFRWAERYRRDHSTTDSPVCDWDQQLANDGYMLLAGKVRTSREQLVIQESIQKHLKKTINPETVFGQEAVDNILKKKLPKEFDHIVFTSPLRKLVIMLHRALMFDEPVLLVGGTGCGKTTACQLVSALISARKSPLSIINCHSHTDASDFLGGLRPVRQHNPDVDGVQNNKLFEWVDGPLVRAMHRGSCILIDEISLAEDAVLERLNSVLEPARTLVIPDRVSSEENELDLTIRAHSGFQFMATMNPGGDFGKKELSPALRNRLTEIWCTAVNENLQEVADIVKHNLTIPENLIIPFSTVIVKFIDWFTSTTFGSKDPRSIRDIMKWVWFCNTCCTNGMNPVLGLIHGALLVFIDGIGSGISDVIAAQSKQARMTCVSFILKSLKEYNLDSNILSTAQEQFDSMANGCYDYQMSSQDGYFVMEPFQILLGSMNSQASNTYSFNAPSTSMNLFRLMRALQSFNPILLEGSPGIGKTSLVVALARATGHDIVRINLSEQTDITDLLGADLPVEDGVGGQFCWRDGPLLTALKSGAWVVFDELNLASQSVLEGLNSVFDHRNEIFVPELGMTFNVKCEETRIFACQNPYYQGGGRKGLPRSFLNRFNQVYMEPLSEADMTMILSSQFPSIPKAVVEKMVRFNEEVKSQVVEKHLWGHAGSPWEFNLRDLTRWCELVVTSREIPTEASVYLIYSERLQKYNDREKMCALYCDVFQEDAYQPTCNFHMSGNSLIVGNAIMQREYNFPVPTSNVLVLPSMLHSMESLMTVLQRGWMAILTGGSGCGKTTLVQTLAALVGKKLRVFAVNSCMDATELLGGFEQIDFLRHLTLVPDGLINDMMDYCNSKTNLISGDDGVLTAEILGSIQDINVMKLEISEGTDVSSALNCGRKLKRFLNTLKTKCTSGVLPPALQTSVVKHQHLLEKVIKKIELSRGKFEWVDSELVEALKAGDWLLVEGANLCNPSVLDRLNALLEPGGRLTVTERGVIDGSFVEITPHPSFRMILSLDTSEGNLSRAMRNRGVEIHMLSPDNNQDTSKSNQVTMCWSEVKRIVECILSFCPSNISSQISSFLLQIFRSGNIKTSNTGASMLSCLNCAQELSEAIAAGDDVKSSLLAVGSRYLDNETLSSLVDNLHESDPKELCHAKIPIVRLNNIIHDTTTAMVFHQGQYFNDVSKSFLCGNDFLYEAVCYFLRLASQEDWQIRIKYISQYVITDPKDLEKFNHALRSVMMSEHYEKLINVNERLRQVPWDFLLNEQLIDTSNVSLPKVNVFAYTNTCILLFVTKLQNCELDQKLQALAAAYSCHKTATKRKSKRRNSSEKNVVVKETGPLVLSHLYHKGTVKSQQLPNPCYVYLLPLYQTIFSYIYECTDMECHFQYNMWLMIQEKILEICYIWQGTLKPTKLGSEHVMMSVQKIEKAFLLISSLYNIKTKNVSSSQHKIIGLFQSINDSLSANWDLLRIQNKVRMLYGSVRLGAATFKSEEEFLISKQMFDLLQKMALMYQGDQNMLLNEQFRNLTFALSQRCSDAVTSRTFSEIDHLPDHDSVDSLNAEFKSISDGLCVSDEQQVSEIKCHQSLTEAARHFMLSNLMDILMYSKRDELAKQVSYFCKILRQTPGFSHIINANVLQHILFLKTSSEKALKEQKSMVIDHLTSAVATLFNESSLTEVLSQDANCIVGASVVLKPLRSKTFFELVCTQQMHSSKNSGSDVPLADLSVVSLGLYNNVSLPLVEYETRMNLLKSMYSSLWEESFRTPHSLHSSPHENLTKCFCAFLHYLHSSLSIIMNIQDMPELLYSDLFCFSLLSSLTQHLEMYRSELFPTHLVDSFVVLTEKVRGATGTPGGNSDWLNKLKDSLAEVMLNASNVMKNLRSCKESKQKLDTYLKSLLIMSYIQLGMAWMGLSAINYWLISPQTNLDPVQFNDFKCDLHKYQHRKYECDMKAYSTYLSALTGYSLFKDNGELSHNGFIHPLVSAQYRRMDIIQSKLSAMKDLIAYRPPESTFKELVQICSQTWDSFISAEANKTLFQNLKHITEMSEQYNFNFNDYQLKNDINKLGGIRASLSTFAKELSKFAGFPDFSILLRDSVDHFCIGCSMIENALKSCFTLSFETEEVITIDNTFNYLMGINSPDRSPYSVEWMSKKLLARINNPELNANMLLEDVLASLLLRIRNIVVFEGAFSGPSPPLKDLVDYVTTELDKQRQAEIRKKEEKASLYKTKNHLEDLDEQQLENEMFYGIFGYNPASEDVDEPTQEGNPPTRIEQSQKFSDNIGKIAMQVHTDVSCLAGITNTSDNAKLALDLPINFSLPSIYANNKLHSFFMSYYDNMLNIEVDENLLNANMITLHQQIKIFEGDFSNKVVACNIYKDPLISEAKCCLPIIEKLVNHINTALLNQWPDNPMLLKILEVCERVKKFSVSSPLIKFVSGMEILLESVQEWEKNACTDVSLKEFMNEIIQLIFKWRKMELSNWGRLIDDQFQKLSYIQPSMYFSLYQLVCSEFDDSTIKDFITQLENFMESSTLPQFCPRLDILATFTGHMSLHRKRGSQVDKALKNVHHYYSQFKTLILERLQAVRKPIEKELKEFVSITRWNDRSFFAMKNSVEKAHKQLFNLVKKFTLAMQEKVQCNALVQGSHSVSFSISSAKNMSIVTGIDELGTEILNDDSVMFVHNSVPSTEFPVLSRLSTFTGKFRKICAYRDYAKFESNITSVEDSITEIIDTAQELRDAKPTTIAKGCDEDAKAKRISEAKNIKLRKQKALTDLFKYLSEIGLSYKKGLVTNKQLTSQELLLTKVPESTTDVKVSASPGNVKVQMNSSKDQERDYFHQIILKWSCMNIACGVPHKDLGKPALDRCVGFVGNLMSHSVSQRELLSTTIYSRNTTKQAIKTLKDLSQESVHSDQSRSYEFILCSSHAVNTMCCLLEEFVVWIECCPEDTGSFESPSQDNISINSVKKHGMTKGSSAWSNVFDSLGKILDEAYGAKNNLDVIIQSKCEISVVTKTTVLQVENLLLTLQRSFNCFVELSSKIFKECSALGNVPKMIRRCASFLTSMMDFAKDYKSIFTKEPENLVTTVLNITKLRQECEITILQKTESLVSSLLVAIQEFKKTEIEHNEDDVLRWMNKLIVEQITKMSHVIVGQEVESLLQYVIANIPNVRTEFIQSTAKVLLVLLQDYQALLHQLEILLRKVNRTTMKLCYVLGGIFLQLCKNGYCTPEDVKEEVDEGDGAELEDAEGGGVGEGEGSNDVSDQIEDQEMLEDKPGEEQDENGNENIEASENAVEMDNDFEGQFDDNEPEEKTDEKSDDEEEQQDIEKQMGDLGDQQNQEKLDEQFWGSDEEPEDEEESKGESTENGPGEEQSQQELAAKDDTPEDANQPENEENEKPNDDSEFNPSEADPYANNNEDQDDQENLNLPDDFNIDNDMVEEEDNSGDADDDDNTEEVDNPEETTDTGGDAEEEEGLEPEKYQGPIDEEQGEGDEEDDPIDMDAQDPLHADEKSNKDESNTINDTTSNDQNQQHDDKDSRSLEQNDSNVPPSENNHDNDNDGLAPVNDLDDKSTQYSRVNKDDKSEPKDNLPNKKQESKSRDNQDIPNEDSTIEERLNIVDPMNTGKEQNEFTDEIQPKEADAYEHVHSPGEQHDKRVFDSVDQEIDQMDLDTGVEQPLQDNGLDEVMDIDDEFEDISNGNKDEKNNLDANLSRSEIHTNILATSNLSKYTKRSEEEVEQIRKKLEETLQSWRSDVDPTTMRDAEDAWENYCYLTRPLAIELCEQLRLVLEPTQASQLKGDYRTGKRLNIRKMIPYIASGYRKDKIWLRRTKPNKRTYQVMLAIDDSSSMVDNHTKQLAFESTAVISGALSSLEVGQFAVCSFGEEVELLQNFGETFTTKSGASFLRRCTFLQEKTKIAKFLDYSTDLFRSAGKMNYGSNNDISQLLLIISDGRGLYLEGRKRVLESVHAIQQTGVFVVFVILDQPNHGQGSISDIKVPVFSKAGQMPEIRSYMRDFPFPFYVILRDINVLPQTLGEALRQWFVLVTSSY